MNDETNDFSSFNNSGLKKKENGEVSINEAVAENIGTSYSQSVETSQMRTETHGII